MSTTTVLFGLVMLGTAWAAEPEPTGAAPTTTTTIAPKKESSRGYRGDPATLPTGIVGFGAPGARPPADATAPQPVVPPPAH